MGCGLRGYWLVGFRVFGDQGLQWVLGLGLLGFFGVS